MRHPSEKIYNITESQLEDMVKHISKKIKEINEGLSDYMEKHGDELPEYNLELYKNCISSLVATPGKNFRKLPAILCFKSDFGKGSAIKDLKSLYAMEPSKIADCIFMFQIDKTRPKAEIIKKYFEEEVISKYNWFKQFSAKYENNEYKFYMTCADMVKHYKELVDILS